LGYSRPRKHTVPGAFYGLIWRASQIELYLIATIRFMLCFMDFRRGFRFQEKDGQLEALRGPGPALLEGGLAGEREPHQHHIAEFKGHRKRRLRG